MCTYLWRESAHTHTHTQMKLHSYLVQWFGFPFHPSVTCLPMLDKLGNVLVWWGCFGWLPAYDDKFKMMTHSVWQKLPLGRTEEDERYA